MLSIFSKISKREYLIMKKTVVNFNNSKPNIKNINKNVMSLKIFNIFIRRDIYTQYLSFLPLLIVTVFYPFLKETCWASQGELTKNILFIIPFCCLVISFFSRLSINSNRQAAGAKEDQQIAMMEVETYLGNAMTILLGLIFTIVLIFKFL